MSLLLLDSNLIINSLKVDDLVAADFIGRHETCCSVISRVESLGYHRLGDRERRAPIAFFDVERQLLLTDAIVDEAVRLRQRRSMSLIAATAIVHGLTLATRNVTDFARIDGLDVVDPYAADATSGRA